MIGRGLVRPLEDDWRETLDALARRRGWPASGDVERLAERVADLSSAYNDGARARASVREAGAARLSFSFVRDVPKGAAAVRELVSAGCLSAQGEQAALRVLDVGAGLGAMTWGIARALHESGIRRRIEATWLDEDRAALDLATDVVRARSDAPAVRTVAGSFDALRALGTFDVVVVGNVLSELGVGDVEDVRVGRHAELLRRLLDRHVAPDGSLVAIEPALRDRTRRLHRVRDVLVAGGAAVFAPCLHASPCPALANEGDWCHEDLAIDLPAWLWPVARAAGLRREGLTFAYVVFRRDGVRLVDRLGVSVHGRPLRVVSGRIASKGKSEAFLCGDFAASRSTQAAIAMTAARARTMRLDRDAGDSNEAWADIVRGDVLSCDPPLDLDRPRVVQTTTVRVVDEKGLRPSSEALNRVDGAEPR